MIVARAQTTINGLVKDENDQPMNKVKIFIKGAFDYTYTDKWGTFTLQYEDTASFVLVAQYPDHADVEMTVRPEKDSSRPIVIRFGRKIANLQGVVVNGRKMDFSTDKAIAIGLAKWDVMTTAGANADIVSAFKTLPGTQKNVGGDGLYVHGGEGYETQTFIDGMMVSKFFYSGAPGVSHRGRFPPSLFTGSYFASGGYSAMYGGALSSVLNLESLDLPEMSSLDINAGTAGIGVSVNKLASSHFSYGGSLNYLNLGPYFSMVKQIYSFQRAPQFLDGTFNFRVKGEKHPENILKFYGSFGMSDLSLYRQDIDYSYLEDYYAIRNRNFFSVMTYETTTKNKWKIFWGVSLSASIDKDTTATRTYEKPALSNFDKIQTPGSFYDVRNTWKKNVMPQVEVNFGEEYQRSWKGLRQDSFYGIGHQYESVGALDNYFSLFGEGTWKISQRWTARLGGREDFSMLMQKEKASPRMLVNYNLDPTTDIHFAYGDFYQKPDYDNAFLFKHNLNFAEAVHYTLGFQKGKFDQSLFRAEVYYKDYKHLLITSTDTTMGGYGYAKGIDLFWKSRFYHSKFEYWISYSYVDAKRKFSYYPIFTQPDFVAKHSFSAVIKRYFSKLSIHTAVSYNYESGKPYYNPNQPDSEFMKDRTPTYHSLDLSVAYVRTIHKFYSIFVFTMTNALNNNQVFGYTYSTVTPGRRIAQTPLARRFFYLGAFFSLGIDRTKEVFNSNL
jgi:vitamin B12 transporter